MVILRFLIYVLLPKKVIRALNELNARKPAGFRMYFSTIASHFKSCPCQRIKQGLENRHCYRPISKLSILVKVIESLVSVHGKEYLASNTMLMSNVRI